MSEEEEDIDSDEGPEDDKDEEVGKYCFSDLKSDL